MSRIFFFKDCLFGLFFVSVLILPSSGYAKKLIFLGDSLTEGYGVSQDLAFPQLIQKKMNQEKLDWVVISSGSSGSTSASTLSRLKWVAKEKPDVVFILMGSNDALRGLEVSQTEKNIDIALSWAKQQKIKIILGQLYAPPNYGKVYDQKFREIFPRLAKKYEATLAPFLLEQVAGKASLNQSDGIHPNEKGHQIIADKMYLFLKKNL